MTETARDVLLDAAYRAFLAKGYEGAGISDILGDTGLSRGAIYHHFKNKLDLFGAVIARYLPFPFDAFDWAAHQALDAEAQKAAIAALYAEAEVQVQAAGGLGRDRYFALFFDALSHLPAYRRSVGEGYARLIAALTAAEERAGLAAEAAAAAARRHVAILEGEVYLNAVLAGAQTHGKD